MSDLRALLSDQLVVAIEALIEERVGAALSARETLDGSPWLSVADAATFLGVSERTVGRLLERGRIRSTHVGRRRLMHRDELDAYLKENQL